jgi:GST-like protein
MDVHAGIVGQAGRFVEAGFLLPPMRHQRNAEWLAKGETEPAWHLPNHAYMGVPGFSGRPLNSPEPFMTSLSDFPIAARWPAKYPDRIQLYSFPTPNGVKASIALEEMGLPYEAHAINILKNETWTSDFLSLNPNGKIPAIIDPNGPGGKPLGLFESGAILTYLADKSGKLMPKDEALRYETLQWVFFQVGGIGPMFGQLGFFHKFGGKDIADKRPLERYRDESKRLVGVLEKRLEGRQWIMGDEYTIADVAIFPWVRGAKLFYEAGPMIGLDDSPNVSAWLERAIARPASQKGLEIPALG